MWAQGHSILFNVKTWCKVKISRLKPSAR
uniref:Uncharacterized protein n=1 Tax=Arundo donax TaxID=35708 RepID=A0A0A8ZRM8_ARUDO